VQFSSHLELGLPWSNDEPPSAANSSDVRFWPRADIPSCTAHVRFQGQSGHVGGLPLHFDLARINLDSTTPAMMAPVITRREINVH
jgi:hypothetical protein